MSSEDVRQLAERAGLVHECEPCGGAGRVGDGVLCGACGGDGDRLPTEAEVRQAIYAARWPVLDARYMQTSAHDLDEIEEGDELVRLEACRVSEQRDVVERGALRAHLILYLKVRE